MSGRKMADEFLDYPGDFDNDDTMEDSPPRRDEDFRPPSKRPYYESHRNGLYENAYGNYRGGYGPGGGYGPPMGPPPMGPPMGPPFGSPFGPPCGPPFPMGSGFGYDRPRGRKMGIPKQIKYKGTIQFLASCGFDREKMKNLPGNLLQLLDPESCGLCNMQFDSYNLSRTHYSSKNHIKKQKKWLSASEQQRKIKEKTLKPREEYCELCDVEITSTAHAESHYAGKIHRGIVSGRKLPRNPFLMQYEMEGRMKQLIAREKKFLTYPEEDVIEIPPKEQPKTAELLCNICQITVTCSEQMTMHLNGKRHLNKEKQHILLMMKPKNAAADESIAVDDAADEDDIEASAEDAKEGDTETKDGDKSQEDEVQNEWDIGNEKWEDTIEQ